MSRSGHPAAMATTVAVAAMVVMGAGCGSSSGSAAPSSSSPLASSSPPPTTVTATSPSAPTTTALPAAPQPTGSEAAQAFVDAWKAGDQARALTVAVPDAVAAVFGADPGSVQSRGCNNPPAGGAVLCAYRTDAGELQVRARSGPDGFYVDQAVLSAG